MVSRTWQKGYRRWRCPVTDTHTLHTHVEHVQSHMSLIETWCVPRLKTLFHFLPESFRETDLSLSAVLCGGGNVLSD